MRIALVILMSLFCARIALASGNGIVIGNGGDGYIVGSDLILRDLFVVSNQQRLFVGPELDPKIEKAVALANFDFQIPTRLLGRKLSDIKGISPELSDLLLTAMRVYHWVLVEQPLALLPEGPKQIKPVNSKVKRVQIANRLDLTVRVQKKYWQRLNDDSKVALFLHETLFALEKPDCLKGACNQSPAAVRAVVGDLFRAASFKEPAVDLLKKRIESLLQISLLAPEEAGSKLTVHFSFDGAGPTIGELDGKFFFDDLIQSEIAEAVPFCEQVAREVAEHSDLASLATLEAQSSIRSFDFEVRDYRTVQNTAEFYLAPALRENPIVKVIRHYSLSSSDDQCLRLFADLRDQYLAISHFAVLPEAN